MTKPRTKPPSGMRDFLPQELARRRYVQRVITEVYETYGFVPLETPAIENLSTLLGKYGDEGDQLLYRILHRREGLRRPLEQAHAEGRPAEESELGDQGLRFDLTVPLARVVAQYGDLPRYFKRYQIQPVWRADRPGRGRFREFYQCDVDITGTASKLAEAEVCGAVASVLQRLGFEDFTIRLNHRQLLRALIEAAGIDAAGEATSLVALDKLDKIGADGVAGELEARGIGAASADSLLSLVGARGGAEPGVGDSRDRLSALAERLGEGGRRAAAELLEVLELCAATPAAGSIAFAPELARGLSYYTGAIFEIAVPGLRGSLGGGGRYDELVGMFSKRAVPAVGFSLGLERILVVMEEGGMYPPNLAVGPELVLCWMGIEPAAALGVARRLRSQGLRVEVYPEASRLERQLQYADSAVQAPWVAIVGPSEAEADRVTLKDLASGEQEIVATAGVAAVLRRG